MRKVDVEDGVTRLIENLPKRQVDEFKVRLKSCEVLGLESSKKPVCAMIGLQTLGHGDTLATLKQRA
jgi:hypothetical protein